MQIKQKILNSLNNNRLNPKEWEKKWYNYNLNIQYLNHSRNNLDWFIIDVSDLNDNYLERVTIQIKPVIEFWCVHNKCLLLN